MSGPTTESLSDEDVLRGVEHVLAKGHHLTAQLLRLLIEVEDRRLHLRAAYSSMSDYCVRHLGLSEGAAFRRITAARLVRRFPSLLPRVERGEVHLSLLVRLRHHLTAENVEELVEATRGKTKYEVAELLAQRAPRPDAPATMRKLPTIHTANAVEAIVEPGVEPIAESRYRLQLTISREVRDKIERVRDLMMHSNPTRDLTAVVERAVDVLLDKLEKQRLGKTSRPVEPPRPLANTSQRVSRAVRRKVFERDGERCTFVADNGRRCASRRLLELDHIVPRSQGGSDGEDNLRVRCRAHNGLHAEDVFGASYVRSRIHLRQRNRAGAAAANGAGPAP